MRLGTSSLLLLIAATLSAAPADDAPSIDSIIHALRHMEGYKARVSYAVTLPQADDDIIYTIDLRQPASADSYLIDWHTQSPSGPVEGFTAWFDGHFYNFRNRRLQEVHSDWDPQAPRGAREPQNAAQFSTLLPRGMAPELERLKGPGYAYELRPSGRELRVEARRIASGETDAELTWTFDASTLRPLRFDADYNPGGIASQQVAATFDYQTPLPGRIDSLSEPLLRERYPDAFTRYRESQFAIEQMRGEPLPAFSLPLAAGSGRLERQRGQRFERPTLIVMLEAESQLTPRLVDDVRQAVDRMPADVDVVWAFMEKNPQAASEAAGELRRGETALCGARPLATDCGAATLPVVMACSEAGTVESLLIGLNNQLATDVICMLSTMKN